MSPVFYYILIPVSIAAVTIILGTGLYGMFRGGEFNRKYSNKLMRLRILLQFIAIVIIMSSVYISTN
tara:strand:+ start:389 stop:589 length:201 start_codon:yes stop_codon:yes gene_type:complete